MLVQLLRQSKKCSRQIFSTLDSFRLVATESDNNLYSGLWPESFVALNNLHDNPGATKKRKRVGRGTGSGRGKTCGRGMKGQRARSGSNPRLLFAGGQTPLSRAVPKKGFHNPNRVDWEVLNLDRLSRSIEQGRLQTDEIITMRSLREAGIVGKRIKHGVKVLGHGAADFKHKVHLQVSKCSLLAEKAIEKNGGSVRLVYYDREGLRGLLKPEAYVKKGWMIPEPARYVPSKRREAYDFPGDVQVQTKLEDNNKHLEVPARKQPDHPGLPDGKGHIKSRWKTRILIDYGKKAKQKLSTEN